MKSVRKLVLALFLGASASIAAADPPPLSIGALLCQTGSCAEWGTNSLKGAELAVRELNQGGGVLGRRLTLKAEDTREADNGALAAAAFRKLSAAEGIHFFIGPTWSTGAAPLIPIARTLPNVLLITPTVGTSDFNEGAENCFNLWPRDEVATRTLARHAIAKGWRSAAILTAETPWDETQGATFEEEFHKGGGKILVNLKPLPDASDLRPEVTRMTAAQPDIVFMSNYHVIPLAARELRRKGFKGQILTVALETSLVQQAPEALEGTLFTRHKGKKPSFQTLFHQNFGFEPLYGAATAYDAVYLLAKAIREAGTDEPAKVREVLKGIKLEGASGSITFDAKRGISREPEIEQVQSTKKPTK